jgi:nesprin-1
LLSNLEASVGQHSDFSNKCQGLRDWLNCEKEKVNVCDDTSGEKTDIKKRIETIKVRFYIF